MANRINWSFIGIPDHTGVAHVHGRVGAAGGPQAFSRLWERLSGTGEVQSALASWHMTPHLTADIVKNHALASQAITEAARSSELTLIVGGGHDHGYSHLKGIQAARPKKYRLGCINIDAHLDLRKPSPLITSGSPFYLALEDGVLKPHHLIEFGIQDHCNRPELWSYAKSKKVPIHRFQDLREGRSLKRFALALKMLASKCDEVVISLDLDAASQAYAPGVSAPQAEGFSASEVIGMMELAGGCKKVKSLGIFELNPVHDENDKTARLAATAAYHFLSSRLGLR